MDGSDVWRRSAGGPLPIAAHRRCVILALGRLSLRYRCFLELALDGEAVPEIEAFLWGSRPGVNGPAGTRMTLVDTENPTPQPTVEVAEERMTPPADARAKIPHLVLEPRSG